MLPLLLASIAMVALIVYNFMQLTESKFNPPDLKVSLHDHMANCRVRSAIEVASTSPTYLGMMVAAALPNVDATDTESLGREDVEDAIGIKARQEVHILQLHIQGVGRLPAQSTPDGVHVHIIEVKGPRRVEMQAFHGSPIDSRADLLLIDLVAKIGARALLEDGGRIVCTLDEAVREDPPVTNTRSEVLESVSDQGGADDDLVRIVLCVLKDTDAIHLELRTGKAINVVALLARQNLNSDSQSCPERHGQAIKHQEVDRVGVELPARSEVDQAPKNASRVQIRSLEAELGLAKPTQAIDIILPKAQFRVKAHQSDQGEPMAAVSSKVIDAKTQILVQAPAIDDVVLRVEDLVPVTKGLSGDVVFSALGGGGHRCDS